MDKRIIANHILKLAKKLLADEKPEYIHDPDHKNNPGGDYHKTEEGWSNTKPENKTNPAPEKPQEQKQELQKPVQENGPAEQNNDATFDPEKFSGEIKNNYAATGDAGCDLKVVHQNMMANLEGDPNKVNKNVKIVKNTSTAPVTQENAKQFTQTAKNNLKTILDRYHGHIKSLGLRNHVEKHVDTYLSSLEEGLKDGSLKDVKECDIDELIRHDVLNILHQQVETNKRQYGDHGVRHNIGNSGNALAMLNELQSAGQKISGRDKLMMLTAMSSHDMGYGVGEPATDPTKGKLHKKYSAVIAKNTAPLYSKVFGNDGAAKIENLIATHDDCVRNVVDDNGKPVPVTEEGPNGEKIPVQDKHGNIVYKKQSNLDWKEDPVAASIRLADTVSLFGYDKVPETFLRSGKSMKLVCHLRTVLDSMQEGDFEEIDDEKHPGQKVKVVGKNRAPEFEAIHDRLKTIIKKDFDNDPELNNQIDEVMRQDSKGNYLYGSIDFENRDVISRYSGKISEYVYDKQTDCMSVKMNYSAEGQIVQDLMGDELCKKKFKSMLEDLEAVDAGATGDTQNSVHKDSTGKDIIKVEISGKSRESINKKATKEMKDYLDHSPRSALSGIKSAFTPPPDSHRQRFETVQRLMHRTIQSMHDDEMKNALMNVLTDIHKEKYTKHDLKELSKRISNIPMTAGEKEYFKNDVMNSSGYIYDPEHTQNPGGGWEKTDKGWYNTAKTANRRLANNIMRLAIVLDDNINKKILDIVMDELEKEFGKSVDTDEEDTMLFMNFPVNDKTKKFDDEFKKNQNVKRVLLDKLEKACDKKLGVKPLLSGDFRVMDTFNFRVSLHYFVEKK